MEPTAEPLLEEGGLFIAVGALHLPGKKGLVALLREAGYTVTADRVAAPRRSPPHPVRAATHAHRPLPLGEVALTLRSAHRPG